MQIQCIFLLAIQLSMVYITKKTHFIIETGSPRKNFPTTGSCNISLICPHLIGALQHVRDKADTIDRGVEA